MNPLPAGQMKPTERRAELCSLLALGLMRLRMKNTSQASVGNGEFPLHNPTGQSSNATASQRRAS